MDKRNSGVTLRTEDGCIRLNTGEWVKPRNEVHKLDINNNLVEFIVSDMFIVKMDADDYFKFSIWRHCLEFGHSDLNRGVVGMDDGLMHRSVPAMIMNTDASKRVGYRSKCKNAKFDLRKSNLYIKGQYKD